MTAEQWRNIPGREGYQVSSLGRVRSLKRGTQILRTNIVTGGNRIFCPSVKGVQTSASVARCVAQAFLDAPLGGGWRARHKNGVTADDRVENLEWAYHGQ